MEDGVKNEVADISDMDGFSANDENKECENKPKKKRRRKREIDMIRIDDDGSNDEDSSTEDGLKKLNKLSSPGPYSPGHSGIREPRQCVLKASQKRKPLSRLLEQLLRNLEKKDQNQFFAWPVNDNFAPNYSNVIKRPMDFSTIKQKIDDNGYRSLNCFIADFKLMCNNAMKYNKNGTVYHKAAKRLLHQGLKQLTPAKLRPLGHILTYMYEIPIRELGFDIGKMDVKVLKHNSPVKSEECEQQSDSAGESKPEQNSAEDDLKLQMEAEREQHRKLLARKAFPRMDADGKTSLCLLLDQSDAALPLHERTPTLGQYIGRLAHGSGSLQTFREDRRNLVSGVKPLDYGPFSSYAPAYDSTFASLTKEESHLLYHTLGVETGAGNEELLRFEPDSPWAAIYDMEEMFPVYKKPEEPTVSPQHDLAKIKVNVEQLRGLAELGVDVEFLADLEEDIEASQRDYGLNNALQHTLKILQRLESEQRERLSGPLPPHLSLVPRAGGAERELARAAVSCLRGMLSRVSPRHVAPLPALRCAMGVTLQHLDTPLLLDDFNEMTPDQMQEKNQIKVEMKEYSDEELVVKMDVEENFTSPQAIMQIHDDPGAAQSG